MCENRDGAERGSGSGVKVNQPKRLNFQSILYKIQNFRQERIMVKKNFLIGSRTEQIIGLLEFSIIL